MTSLPPVLCAYVELLATRCRTLYGEELRSLVLYGSIARGTFGPGSDVDLLVVLRRSPLSWGKRISRFIVAVVEHAEVVRAAAGLRSMGLPWRVEPMILTEDELAAHPPLLLDLTEDAVPLDDEQGVFAHEIARVRDRLAELGARRVWLGPDRWYWILTPAIRPGEVITI